MPIFSVQDDARPWITLVVRAADVDQALILGTGVLAEYGPTGTITAELLDPNGPPAVLLIEDS